MGTPIRAIYEKGHLRLLDPVDLAEGQEVHVEILSERERVIQALGDLIARQPEVEMDTSEDDLPAQAEIDEALRGTRPLSEIIIEERQERL